jgi:hypothetical protein
LCYRVRRRQGRIHVGRELVYFKDQDPDSIPVAPLSECKQQPGFKRTDAEKRIVSISPDTPEEANSWIDACRRAASGVGACLPVSWQDFAVVEPLVTKDADTIELVRLTSDDFATVIKSKQEMLKFMHPFVAPLIFILLPDPEGRSFQC